MDVDPKEFAGMSRNQVAAELHGMAMAKKNLEYASEDFYVAADQVLAASGETRHEGVRW